MDLSSLLPDARSSPFERDHAHMLVQAREYQEAHQGLLPDTPFWHSMELRQSEHFARFTHWHPDMSRWITENANAEHSLIDPQSPIPRPPLIPRPTDPVVIVADPPPPNAVNTPEPSSFTIAALAVVLVAIGWYSCHGRDVLPKTIGAGSFFRWKKGRH